VIKEKKEL
jgi:quercetin dioxygenase-like cupin family protein